MQRLKTGKFDVNDLSTWVKNNSGLVQFITN